MKQNKMHELYEEARLNTTSPERRMELYNEMIKMSEELTPPKDIDKIK